MRKLLISMLLCMMAIGASADEQRKVTLSGDHNKETINLSYCNIFISLNETDDAFKLFLLGMEIDAIDKHLALRRCGDARKHVEQSGLARARSTHDAHKPALALGEVYVSQANCPVGELELEVVAIERQVGEGLVCLECGDHVAVIYRLTFGELERSTRRKRIYAVGKYRLSVQEHVVGAGVAHKVQLLRSDAQYEDVGIETFTTYGLGILEGIFVVADYQNAWRIKLHRIVVFHKRL